MKLALRRVEDGACIALLGAMVLLPIGEIALRWAGMPSTILLVQHLTPWIGFLGAGIASRERRHLSLATLTERLPARFHGPAAVVAAAAAGSVAVLLAWASVVFALSLRGSPALVQGVPPWVWALPLPIGFSLVAVRETLAAGIGEGRTVRHRVAAALLVALVVVVAVAAGEHRSALVVPGLVLLVLAVGCGAPLFALLGGAALLLFAGEGTPVAAIPAEAYRLVVNATLPTLPLFTLAGYFLAEGGAAGRIAHLFRVLFGWMPGGLAIAAAVACAFFTSFTGGSGVTILALGGLFLPALLAAGHRDRFSVGLLTAGGSLGLLFPPSLPIIMYGVISKTPIDVLFAGALLPGMLLLLAIAGSGFIDGVSSKTHPRLRASGREALAALWAAKWELALPPLALVLMFGGFATMVQAAAITAAYAFVVECVIKRDLTLREGVPRVMVTTATVIGGVLTILGVALGLTSYLVDAQVPSRAAEWLTARIKTKFGFLLALNVFLLLVGCVMDVFSAIVVVVPIIVPVAMAYGVDPVHLGVIFIANLELGYLTPPVGLNLFLASYRFHRPLAEVWRATVPFFLLLLAVVIVITYVPALTEVGVRLFG